MRGEFGHGNLGRIGPEKMKIYNNGYIGEVHIGEYRLFSKPTMLE
jgi:hypothetical protein